MPNNRGLTKEDVVYIHSIILLGKKICNLQRCRPRNCHTEWSKSEKEKQILHINAYMWILKKKWYRWSYFQSRNRDRDVENNCVVTNEGFLFLWEVQRERFHHILEVGRKAVAGEFWTHKGHQPKKIKEESRNRTERTTDQCFWGYSFAAWGKKLCKKRIFMDAQSQGYRSSN